MLTSFNIDYQFTPRQLQILRLAAWGKSIDAISRDLGIARQTVKNHGTNMYTGLFGVRRPAHRRYRLLAIHHALSTGQLNWREI